MKVIFSIALVGSFFSVLNLAFPPNHVHACAIAPMDPKDAIRAADETALILWNAETKTEHFIRSATFETNAKEFGFLVPTPTKPELGEVGATVFDSLKTLTAPKIVQQARTAPPKMGCGCGSEKSATMDYPAPAGGVQVLAEQRVAGLDSAILEASNADALTKWLADHKYPVSDKLKPWIDHYVQKKWFITAFKIPADATPEKEIMVQAKALRISFQTDKPFYPYKEPPVPRPYGGNYPPRMLRVYFIGEERVEGFLGDSTKAWPAKTVWSDALSKETREQLTKDLMFPANSNEIGMRLTEFEDRSTPRPGFEDVFFGKADMQAPVHRPDIIQYVQREFTNQQLAMAIFVGLLAMLFPYRKLRPLGIKMKKLASKLIFKQATSQPQ